MLMATNSFVVITLDSFLLPITEEVRVVTRQRSISTCVIYYSKFERELSAFSIVKGLFSQKWSRSLTRAFHYRVEVTNGVSQCWS